MKDDVIVGLYVDDVLRLGNDPKHIELTKDILLKSFKMKDLGKVDKFLGMNIRQREGQISISFSDYIFPITLTNCSMSLRWKNAMLLQCLLLLDSL
jgi:hypothetical protein